MNCGEIVSMRGVTPATVSHHLKILSEAKMIIAQILAPLERTKGKLAYVAEKHF